MGFLDESRSLPLAVLIQGFPAVSISVQIFKMCGHRQKNSRNVNEWIVNRSRGDRIPAQQPADRGEDVVRHSLPRID
jgi:hypothetical protein